MNAKNCYLVELLEQQKCVIIIEFSENSLLHACARIVYLWILTNFPTQFSLLSHVKVKYFFSEKESKTYMEELVLTFSIPQGNEMRKRRSFTFRISIIALYSKTHCVFHSIFINALCCCLLHIIKNYTRSLSQWMASAVAVV